MDIKRFSEIIKESENIVFFGGAGVSTESGIKDYRSSDGIYNAVNRYGLPPEEILSHDFLFNHSDIFYRFYAEYFLNVKAEPNKAHLALTELEKSGKLKAVITQNIDGLHQRAGTKNVLELHGTTDKYYCASCHADYPAARVGELNGEVPHCEKCGGLVRPRVTMYGEMLDSEVEERAINAIGQADMLIVGGTSLVVYPAAAYLNYFRGKYTVLINKGATPFDEKADFVFRDSIGMVLSKAVGDALGR